MYNYILTINGIPATTRDGRIARLTLDEANRLADALYEKDDTLDVSVVYAD